MFSAEAMAYLWEVVSYGVNLAVTGGTSTGKSLTLNAIGNFIPDTNRIVSVEDRRELELPHSHWMPMTTTTDTTMSDVVEDAIRSRPQYIFLDELRSGAEAGTLFQAAATGHTVLFTMHAPTVTELATRLSAPPLSVPDAHIAALDVVVNVSRHTVNSESVNRCREISQPEAQWNGSPETLSPNPVSTWDTTSDSHEYALQDSHVVDQIAELELTSTDVISDRIATRRAILTELVERDCTDGAVLSQVLNEFETSPDTRPVTTGEDDRVTEWITKCISNPASNT
jgi:flagellar protein FlaI